MNFHKDEILCTADPGQAQQVLDFLLPFLKKNPRQETEKLIPSLIQVFGNSNFLSRWALRFPEKVGEELQKPLLHPWNFEDFRFQLRQQIRGFPKTDRQTFLNCLTDFKYRQFFRITLRDLGFKRPFPEIVGEFSQLARAILDLSLEWQAHQLGREAGISLKDLGSEFSIIAMGKLGGNELNYSSDIDLIYFYQTEEITKNRKLEKKGLSLQEFYTRLGERLTKLLSEKTPEGFLYRVDLELRPEGKSGALVNSLDSMEDYYETFGAPWERQAFIKASHAAGSELFVKKLLERIHSFIYPKTADFSFLKDVKEMKEKIIKSIQGAKQKTYHVKLGDGGIREIEFFIQSLQHLFGGKLLQLQMPNTLTAIQRLLQAQLITASGAKDLESAYVFLRTLEHRLQLAEEQQTHRLPEAPQELYALARRMGYRNENPELCREKMLKDLLHHRKVVQTMFEGLLDQHL